MEKAPLSERDPELSGIIRGVFTHYALLGHPAIPAPPSIHQCAGLADDPAERCGFVALKLLGEVPLCEEHHRKVLGAAETRPRITRKVIQVDLSGPDTPLSHVVYYIGDPDTQLVKIGTTRQLPGRMRSIRNTRPRALLLATEPGDGELEHDRHKQFRALNNPLPNGEREWYRKAPILMDHIGNLRTKHGILTAGGKIYKSWIAPLKFGYSEPVTKATQREPASSGVIPMTKTDIGVMR